jgi:GT2 family glycosyltransferase
MGLTEVFLSPGVPRPEHWIRQFEEGPLPAVPGTLLARRAVFDAIGGWDESLRVTEDFDWIMRARDAGFTIISIESVLLRYRIHADNISRERDLNRTNFIGVLRDSVHRKLAASREVL